LRLAVFTSQFPCHGNTFFARDIQSLLKAGIEIDIFPFYPLEPALWHYVPDFLNESILPRRNIHHLNFSEGIGAARPWPIAKIERFLGATTAVSASATRFGVRSVIKSIYVCLKAWAWAQQYHTDYDHVLAYWGNYAATCAYVYHRLINRPIPFSMFLHAGMDLYENQVYLRQKLLYADNIIVVCEFNRQFIHNYYKDISHLVLDKITTYHLGLDFAEFPYEPNNRSRCKVLAVGRLEKYKGFDYLLRAVHDLGHRGINCEVEFVGDGTEAGSLKALAKELRILERVRFLGWLRFDDVQTRMRQATFLVHPSNGLGDAVPTVIKESMALGTPVIASDVAGIPELLDHGRCGMLVPPRDVTALAGAIEMMLMNVSLRRGYADAARSYAEEKFDLWRNGQRLADLIRSTTRLEQRKPK
jgi:glycosyltransferase involved in cell wall biosynthesis